MTNIANSTYFAAIPGSNGFNSVNSCGACVQIANGGTKIVATVIDECPTDNGQNPACTTAGHLDLSHAAWAALGYSTGNPSGTTWKFIACPISASIQVVLKSGNANQVYIQNTIFPVTQVTCGGSQATHLSYGAWQLPSGCANAVGASLTLTDVQGHTVTGTVPSGGGSLGVQFPSPGACP